MVIKLDQTIKQETLKVKIVMCNFQSLNIINDQQKRLSGFFGFSRQIRGDNADVAK
jgi:hypothetical protein